MYRVPTSLKTARPLIIGGVLVPIGTTLSHAQIKAIKKLAALMNNGTIVAVPDMHARTIRDGRSTPTYLPPMVVRTLTTDHSVPAFTYVVTNRSVAFNSSTSADADGTITRRRWDWGDESASLYGNVVSPTHVFPPAGGTFTVTLTVMDDDQMSVSVSHDVVVQPDTAPVATFTHSESHLVLSVDATGSSDADGTVASYTWHWGDGSALETKTTPTATHTFATGGAKTVGLTVHDNEGVASTEYEHSITLTANVAPEAGFTSVVDKLEVTFTDTSTDSDGTIASYSWDFGDGSALVTTQNPVHTYTTAGVKHVTLTVTDDDGATDSVTNDVTAVANVAPTASFTSVADHLAVTFTSTSTDSDGTIAAYDWDYGDGTTPHGAIASPVHTYSEAGTWPVTLTVTDDDGATDDTTNDVTVSA